jgi:hypothetical protein
MTPAQKEKIEEATSLLIEVQQTLEDEDMGWLARKIEAALELLPD